MKLVECPICESKFDIEKVPNGTKLKCGKCKKVFGIVQDGELVPILEEESRPIAPPLPQERPKPALPKKPLVESRVVKKEEAAWVSYEEAEKAKEVSVRPARPMPKGTISARVTERRIPPAEVKKAPKPELLLVIGGLIGLVAIGVFIYIWSVKDKFPGKPLKQPPAREESRK